MPWDRTGNRLLLQSGLGKSKPSTFDLPDQQFVYGKLTPDDPEKVNSIIYNWQDHQKSINQHEQAHKDLIATNKKALSQLHHTSSQFSSFRKTNTLFKPVKEGTNVIKIHLPE